MPERFPFTGLTGEQPAVGQVQTSCHWPCLSAGLRAALHCKRGKNLSSLCLTRCAFCRTRSFSHVQIYLDWLCQLMGQVPPPLFLLSLFTQYPNMLWMNLHTPVSDGRPPGGEELCDEFFMRVSREQGVAGGVASHSNATLTRKSVWSRVFTLQYSAMAHFKGHRSDFACFSSYASKHEYYKSLSRVSKSRCRISFALTLFFFPPVDFHLLL